MMTGQDFAIASRSMPLARDEFLRSVLRHVTGTLELMNGFQEASAIVSVAGQRLGREIDRHYRKALAVDQMSCEQVAETIVDLERQLEGEFHVIEQSDERIVLGNRRCPFGGQVKGRPSLCMMTSNLIGVIAADNLGYAHVVVEEAIANGDGRCRVAVHLRQPPAGGEIAPGREYFRAS